MTSHRSFSVLGPLSNNSHLISTPILLSNQALIEIGNFSPLLKNPCIPEVTEMGYGTQQRSMLTLKAGTESSSSYHLDSQNKTYLAADVPY